MQALYGAGETEVKDPSTSQPSVATTVTIDELKQELLAAVGKWAIGIIGTLIGLAVVATSRESGQDNRIGNLEVFQKTSEIRFKDQDELNDKFADIARDVKWITDYMGKPKDNNP